MGAFVPSDFCAAIQGISLFRVLLLGTVDRVLLNCDSEAVSYGVRIGTSTFSEFNKSSQVPITRKKF